MFPSFVEESAAVMYIDLPDTTTGACPVGDTPVYRVWDNRADTNHRYTTDSSVRAHMVAQGWVAEGYGPDQVIMCAPPASPSAFVPPPCKGNNPKVAVPGGPHGMYVWNPNHRSAAYQSALANDVIGKDPTLCGASLVIYWSDVEATKGVFDWSSVTAAAKPYTDAGLTVNLLFSDVTEGLVNTVTPAWVTDPVSKGGAGVPTVSCAGQPSIPVYFNAGYEAAWGAFIAAAVHQFSFSNSALAASVGYMRFATAGGAEALPPPGYNDGAACEALWTAAGFSYNVWNTQRSQYHQCDGQPAHRQADHGVAALHQRRSGCLRRCESGCSRGRCEARRVFLRESRRQQCRGAWVDSRPVQSSRADRQPPLVSGVYDLRWPGAVGTATDNGNH
jgi:hypothetical protein